jgi:hypothetical protein
MDYATFAQWYQQVMNGEKPTIDEKTAFDLIDVARQTRTPLSVAAVGQLTTAVQSKAPEGYEILLDVNQAQVRVIVAKKKARASVNDFKAEG